MLNMLKAMDFFCGAGGMTNGLLAAGIDVLAGLDSHRPCRSTYEHPGNNTRPCGAPVKFIQADIESLRLDRLADEAEIVPDDDSLVFSGCSPCQYWTKINTSRTKSEASKTLLYVFQRFVDAFRPGYVVVENVPGLRTRPNESGLSSFFEFLTASGYGYDEGNIVAFRYGVPQKRRRYLLMATRLAVANEKPNVELPPPDAWNGEYAESIRVRAFIGRENGFSSISAGHSDPSTFRHSANRLSSANLERIRKTKKNGGKRSAWSNESHLQIDAYRGKDDYFRDVYGRMSWDEPAPTITTRFNSLSNGRFGHPDDNRALSIREGATLQTFRTSYIFEGSNQEVARQIGNAVPPMLAERIGRKLIEHWTALHIAASERKA